MLFAGVLLAQRPEIFPRAAHRGIPVALATRPIQCKEQLTLSCLLLDEDDAVHVTRNRQAFG